ncbi:aldo/keto reductase [Bosea lathyri]|uniref:Aryl-alcohol dehydrogenase (NADP+) n=1 Tax=Bosea lathyri TaxID=1036778 RepID=A0A1H6CAI3_9HYPH|nr:aldo/keto reductase [Bosea lathyri]SEG69767.1 aryl-alcohol dehydrogenase (NADP+) [Bosea lathyri]
MNYRRLGSSGMHVSRLCLGAMMFGDQTAEDEAQRIVARAREAGVNFIDTADSYTKGRSEELVGRAIAGDRDHWILATKIGATVDPSQPNRGGLGRRWLMQGVEESLKRLGTDRIDLYYLHMDDRAVASEETVETLGELIRQDKIGHWGVSNFASWRIAELIRLCGVIGTPKPVAAQPPYNAMTRMAEVEYIPACVNYGLGVVPYSPLARGVLTGKYRPGVVPGADTRAGRNDPRLLQTEFRPESLAIAERIRGHVEARGGSMIGFALNWVLANPAIPAVIAGPRSDAQWAQYLAALDQEFDAEDETFLDSLVPPGHASTPGYTDPLYPVAGRGTGSSLVRA